MTRKTPEIKERIIIVNGYKNNVIKHRTTLLAESVSNKFEVLKN